jgi:hypothetical protein
MILAPPNGLVSNERPAGESPIVNALGVVVLDIFSKQPSQVAQDDHVIEKLATNRSHEAFRCSILRTRYW